MDPIDGYVYLLVYPYEVVVGDLFPDDASGQWPDDVEEWMPVTAVSGTMTTAVTITCETGGPFAFPKRSRSILQVQRLRSVVFEGVTVAATDESGVPTE